MYMFDYLILDSSPFIPGFSLVMCLQAKTADLPAPEEVTAAVGAIRRMDTTQLQVGLGFGIYQIDLAGIIS